MSQTAAMTPRYDIPAEELDRVHVDPLEQVTEQTASPQRQVWDGGLLLPGTAAGGGGADADGE